MLPARQRGAGQPAEPPADAPRALPLRHIPPRPTPPHPVPSPWGRGPEYQAEVALLSRRILVQGSPQTEQSRLGPHIFINRGKARIRGVQARPPLWRLPSHAAPCYPVLCCPVLPIARAARL